MHTAFSTGAARRRVGRAAGSALVVLASLGGVVMSAGPAAAICPADDPFCDEPADPEYSEPMDASFDWTVSGPGIRAGRVADTPDTTSSGTLFLDACSSYAGPSGAALYSWRLHDEFSGKVWSRDTTGCRAVEGGRQLNGRWTVTLTLKANDGSVATQQKTLAFRDVLVAVVGDSASSGEGSPVLKAGINVPTHGYADARCDRSTTAAAALAAADKAKALGQKATLTFWNLSCSGASVTRNGDGSNEGGLLFPYSGANKPKDPSVPPLPPQLDQLEQLMKTSGRSPDTLLVQAGANDTGWATMIGMCYINNKYDAGACQAKWGPGIAERVASLNAAGGRYDQMAARIAQLVHRSRVAMIEYWDPTTDDQHIFDPWSGPGFGPACPADPAAPGPADRKWGRENAVMPLNTAVEKAARRLGYRHIGGIAAAFHKHGYCASSDQRWITSLAESTTQQGTEKGAWHANPKGQRIIADKILTSGVLDPGPVLAGHATGDLVYLKQANTPDGHAEVHTATAASAWKTGGGAWHTKLPNSDRGNGVAQVAGGNLYFIKTRNTGSGRVEIHMLTGISGYQTFGLRVPTPISSADADNGTFQMSGGDLYFIKTRNTGSGKIEVHRVSGASTFASYDVHAATAIGAFEGGNGTFQVVGADLYFIKTRNTQSGKIEVHRVPASGGYAGFDLQVATVIGSYEADNGTWQMAGGDLYFVKTRNTGTGKIEVHRLTASSTFQSFGDQHGTRFQGAEHGMGAWQIGSVG